MRATFLTISVLLATIRCSMANADEFVTSYWYGPPPDQTNFQRYQEIKDANFNVVFPPALGNAAPEVNHRILDYCQKLGMKAVISDARIPLALSSPDAKKNLDAMVADYKHHPALLAYYITDEPSAAAFPALAEVVAYLKQIDPAHPGYINLFPTYAAPGAQLGTDTYTEYVDRFVTTVNPFVISYDHYALIQSGDRPDFFENLAVIRNAAIKSNRPFWNIVLVTQHFDYRHLTEPELRYQAMQSLAFGARGILWYTYWYPGPSNPAVAHAIINHDGTRNPHYDMIKQINAAARAIGNELLHARCWATYHAGEPVLLKPPQQQSPIEVTGPGVLTIGVFTHTDNVHKLALIANRDYRHAIQTRVHVLSGNAMIEHFDPMQRAWSEAKHADPLTLDIPAGDGALIRWK